MLSPARANGWIQNLCPALRRARKRRDKTAVDRRDEHSVNSRVRVKCRGEPLLSALLRIRTRQHFRYFRQRLVVFDNAAGPDQIVADKMAD